MKVFEGFGDLVNDEPDVDFLQYSLSNNVMKVSLHKFKD